MMASWSRFGPLGAWDTAGASGPREVVAGPQAIINKSGTAQSLRRVECRTSVTSLWVSGVGYWVSGVRLGPAGLKEFPTGELGLAFIAGSLNSYAHDVP